MSQLDFMELSKLGEGSFGSVFKVRRLTDSLQYALKKVSIFDMKEKEKKNALNEVRIMASLNHPNVIQYKDAFLDERTHRLNIVMQLAPKGDLASRISNKLKSGEGFFEYELWRIGHGILNGLQYLHGLKIIHRDLKPANIFFSQDDTVKLGDLNVSRVVKNALVKTQTGTPNYASPEVWDNLPYGCECDVWSFGCIMYEMCCFKPPFRSKSIQELYQKVKAGIFESIPKRYSSELEEVIKKCLSKKSSRIAVQDLLNIFSQYSSIVPEKSDATQSEMLKTIELPKRYYEFKMVLPKNKYLQVSETQIKEPRLMKNSSSVALRSKYMNLMGKQCKVWNPEVKGVEKSLETPTEKRPIASQPYSSPELPQHPPLRIVLSSKEIRMNVSVSRADCKPLDGFPPEHKSPSFKSIVKSISSAKIILKNSKYLEKVGARRSYLRSKVEE